MRLVQDERHEAEPCHHADGVRARQERRKAFAADGVPQHVVQRDGEEQEQPHAPRAVEDAQQQIGQDHDQRIGKLGPRLLERAQIVLAHGNSGAHTVAVLRARLLQRVEALATHGVAARLVPPFLVQVPITVAGMRVLPTVEMLAIDDHAAAVHMHFVAFVVGGGEPVVGSGEPVSLPAGSAARVAFRMTGVAFGVAFGTRIAGGRTPFLHVHAVPSHVHLVALLAVVHVHAVAP